MGVVEKAIEILDQYVSRNHLKQSQQRKDILQVFFNHPGHLSVDEITSYLRKKEASVGPATVYRGVKVLTEAGIVDEKRFDGKKAVYELAIGQKHHDHLICQNCGKITEFINEKIEQLQEKVADQYGFKILNHHLEIMGLCKDCQK